MEYGYSCMGYEIAGGLGVKMADPSREVYVMVGDGSFLMMASEIATSVQEGYKLNLVVLDNHGFSSIGGLSQAIGSKGFGTDYRCRTAAASWTASYVPVDLVALCAGLGARTVRARHARGSGAALRGRCGSHDRTTAVVIEVDKEQRVPGLRILVGRADLRGFATRRASARPGRNTNRRSRRSGITRSRRSGAAWKV